MPKIVCVVDCCRRSVYDVRAWTSRSVESRFRTDDREDLDGMIVVDL